MPAQVHAQAPFGGRRARGDLGAYATVGVLDGDGADPRRRGLGGAGGDGARGGQGQRRGGHGHRGGRTDRAGRACQLGRASGLHGDSSSRRGACGS
ncbi:hypothetical protein CP975_32425 [Streptomyces alboniger]|uniref:Uncharacterized protein n=1 Tax=Streptomyces alboniger TaxID=132473 RepID=A0A5J6HQ43_STRAD|nr:hypothetical protein CP975_32425 [Streptomyces alboniger]